jgi:hypothetical protein
MHPKVFCIGMHKTGTTSFHQFMAGFGYRSLHDTRSSMAELGLSADNAGEEGDGRRSDLAGLIGEQALRRVVDRYDCFSDNPWPVLYAHLDAAFSGSRFVLTVRDSDDWLRSQIGFFGGRNTRMRQWIYGYGNPLRHPERYREVYEDHVCTVRRHFAGRSEFLEMRIGEDNLELGARLWAFLGLEGEPHAFPLSNARR